MEEEFKCPRCGGSLGTRYIRRFVKSQGDKRGYHVRYCTCGYQKWSRHNVYLCKATVISNKKILDYIVPREELN